jgi:hypothetical protein
VADGRRAALLPAMATLWPEPSGYRDVPGGWPAADGSDRVSSRARISASG